jgi:hypothetical protein
MKDPAVILENILNVVIRTENIISNINNKLDNKTKDDSNNNNNVLIGGNIIKNSKNVNQEKIISKLDTIISILKDKKETTNNVVNNKSSSLKDMGSATILLSNGLLKFSIIPKNAKTDYINFVSRLFDIFDKKHTNIDKNAKNFQTMSNAISVMTSTLVKLSKNILFILPFEKLLIKVIGDFENVFLKLGNAQKNIKQGNISLNLISGSIKNFAISISLLGITFAGIGALFGGGGIAVTVTGIAIGMIGIASAIMIFSDKKVKEGIKTFNNVGKGFIILAGGISLMALTFVSISALFGANNAAVGVLAMTSSLLAIGGVFAFFGVLNQTGVMKRGVNAIKDIGVGFLMLAGGISLMALSFALSSKLLGIKPLALGGAIAVAMIGVGVSFMMMGKMSSQILLGSLSVAVIGMGLVVLSIGIKKMFDNIQDKSWEDIGKIGTFLLGLSAAFVGLSYASPFIAVSSGVVLLMGASLISLSAGIKKFNENKALDFDTNKFKELTKGLADGFGIIGLNPILMKSIRAVGMIGRTLSKLASGVGAWAKLQNIQLITGYDKDGNPIYGGHVDIDMAMQNIMTFIGDGKNKGIIVPFKTISEIEDKREFIKGIRMTRKIGRSLSLLASGVGNWAKLQNIPIISGYDKNGKPIYEGHADIDMAMQNINTFISGGGGSKSIVDVFSAFDMERSDRKQFKAGLRSAMLLGKSLSDLAKGIGGWANLQNIPLIDGYDKNGKPIYKGSVNIDLAISQSISAIEKLATGLIGLSGGNIIEDISGMTRKERRSAKRGQRIAKNNTSLIGKAVNAIAPIGDMLSDFAEGLSTFANIENIKLEDGSTISISKITQNIAGSISMLSSNLINIAGEPDAMGKYPKTKALGRITKVLSPIGEMVSNYAEGLSTFANLSNVKVKKLVLNPKTGREEWVDTNENIDIKTVTSNLASSISILATNISKINIDKKKTKHVMEFLSEFSKQLVKFSNIATPFEKFANSFDKFSNSMKSFAINFSKLSPNSIKMYTEFTNAMTSFSKLDINKVSNNVDMLSKMFNGNDTEKSKVTNVVESKKAQSMIEKMNNQSTAKVPVATTKTEKDNRINILLEAISEMSMQIVSLQNILRTQTIDVNVTRLPAETKF